MRVFLGQEAACEVSLEPVEVHLPPGRVLCSQRSIVEYVGEDKLGGVVFRPEFEAILFGSPV